MIGAKCDPWIYFDLPCTCYAKHLLDKAPNSHREYLDTNKRKAQRSRDVMYEKVEKYLVGNSFPVFDPM